MSQTDIDAALAEAIAAQNAANDAVQPSPAPDAAPRSDAAAMGLPDFVTELASSTESAAAIDMLHDIDLTVTIELGRTHLHVSDVLRLGAGSVVELDKLAGDPVDVYVNERLVARGEVLVLNDTFCVRVNEIVMPPSRLVG
jgi:flagellar motor switch protein FliN/FliY